LVSASSQKLSIPEWQLIPQRFFNKGIYAKEKLSTSKL